MPIERVLTGQKTLEGPAGVVIRSTSFNVDVIAEDGRTEWELQISTTANSGVSAAIANSAELRVNAAGALVLNTHTVERTHEVLHPVVNGVIAAVSAGIRLIDPDADRIEPMPAGSASDPIRISVRVPAGSDITVTTGSGRVKTTGVLGTIIASTTTGDITIDTAEKANLVSSRGAMAVTRVHKLSTTGARSAQAYDQVHTADIRTVTGSVTILNLGHLAVIQSHADAVIDINGPDTTTVRSDAAGQLTLRGGVRAATN